MDTRMLEVIVLGLISALLCGIAGEMGETFATVIFACLTFGIILLLIALTKSGDDAYWR
jgi:hypothetical protein